MKRIISVLLVVLMILTSDNAVEVKASEIMLNALSACIIDGDNNRVLYEKNGYEVRSVASTTKIMTCILALENSNYGDVVTFSEKAAKMPDVQMNGVAGEQYYMKDMLYAMMLESYNDVAVAIAETISGSQENFAKLMNEKAQMLGCQNTYFITPNGLDAQDEYGCHSSTAVDMAHITSYAIKNSEFLEIIRTKSYSFSELSGKRSVSVNNKDAFLDMMSGALGVKTGFTNKAGYCFVGALERDGKTLISVVLGSGWPPSKTLKWKDTCALMNYGLENFNYRQIYKPYEKVASIMVLDGKKERISCGTLESVFANIADFENVSVGYNVINQVRAPVKKGQIVGEAIIYIDGKVYKEIPVTANEGVEKVTFCDYWNNIFKWFLF